MVPSDQRPLGLVGVVRGAYWESMESRVRLDDSPLYQWIHPTNGHWSNISRAQCFPSQYKQNLNYDVNDDAANIDDDNNVDAKPNRTVSPFVSMDPSDQRPQGLAGVVRGAYRESTESRVRQDDSPLYQWIHPTNGH